ncbi:uncharacterized protein LOC124540800 [Vanessa cardui]|uniref:uncharacterized protein LOC124540800 n=1 Tax=Vanessa cardui TaxID=171605 RepID=UPI001F13D13B|nr:uncharacterized protein LOC124540800 [Vanessa cardui]
MLPKEKQVKLHSSISNIVRKPETNIKEIQSIIGQMNFASFVVPLGRLNYRQLQKLVITYLRWEVKSFKLNNESLAELQWWLQHLRDCSVIHEPHPTHYMVTDASDQGWGARINNVNLSGVWSKKEEKLHCNHKEFLAILRAFEEYSPNLHYASVHLQCDNKTAVAYLRNEGGTKSQTLLDLTYKIFHLLHNWDISLTINHIPGIYNAEADRLSRLRTHPEWHVLPQGTSPVFARWGTPVVDLFASNLARVVKRYCSLDCRDNQAEFHNALSQVWTQHPLAWVFPPPFLIPKVLQHLHQCQGIFLIVAPRWEKVFWRADLKSRAIAAPWTIRNLPQVLIDISTGLPPQNVSKMVLEVWKCGGGMNN